MFKPFPIFKITAIIVLFSVSATNVLAENNGSEDGSRLICAKNLDICFEDDSSLLELPDRNGAYRHYSGQTWSASWGFWDDNDWPDLYVNHHTRRATINRFPVSHLALNLGRDRHWAFIEMPGKDQHSAAFIDIDRDGDEDLIEVTGGISGTAATDYEGAFNALHLNELAPPDPTAAAIAAGLEGAGMRGRSTIPFTLCGQSYLFFANVPHKENDEYGSAVFASSVGGIWRRESLFYAVQCDNCDPVPIEIAHFTGATFGDISDDGTTDALIYSNRDDTRELAVFIGRPDGKLVNSGKINTKKPIQAVQILDLDGDLKADTLLQLGKSIGVVYSVGEANPEDRLSIITRGEAKIAGFASGDFNNDSLVDAVVYLESDDGDFKAKVVRNLGHRKFDVGPLRIRNRRGNARNVAVADFDLDGALDLIFTDGKGTPKEAFELGGGYVLMRGVNKGNWLSVDVFDDDGVRSLGAYVDIKFGGTERFSETTSGITDEVQNSRRLHFGMGEATLATVNVQWDNGQSQTITNVQANQLLKVIRPAGE